MAALRDRRRARTRTRRARGAPGGGPSISSIPPQGPTGGSTPGDRILVAYSLTDSAGQEEDRDGPRRRRPGARRRRPGPGVGRRAARPARRHHVTLLGEPRTPVLAGDPARRRRFILNRSGRFHCSCDDQPLQSRDENAGGGLVGHPDFNGIGHVDCTGQPPRRRAEGPSGDSSGPRPRCAWRDSAGRRFAAAVRGRRNRQLRQTRDRQTRRSCRPETSTVGYFVPI